MEYALRIRLAGAGFGAFVFCLGLTSCGDSRMTPKDSIAATSASAFSGTFAATAKPVAIFSDKWPDPFPPANWMAPRQAIGVFSDAERYTDVPLALASDQEITLEVHGKTLVITTIGGRKICYSSTFSHGREELHSGDYFQPFIPFISWGDRNITLYLDAAGDLLVDHSWHDETFLMPFFGARTFRNVQFVIMRTHAP